jgi:hypothetical protein
MISPKELRKLTDEALVNAEKERTRQAEEQLRIAEENKKKRENRAATILAEIPAKAREAAVKGSCSVAIMRLEYPEFDKPSGTHFALCEPQWLKGAAKIVWDHCVEANLKPRLEHWHDGVGIHESFDIIVQW